MVVKPSVHISKLTFANGQEFSFKRNEKIVFVGPNNSGKSQVLRDISAISGQKYQVRPLVVSDVVLEKTGSIDDLRRFLELKAVFFEGSYRYNSWGIEESTIGNWGGSYLPVGLDMGFIKNITADDRLNICRKQKNVGPDDQKTMPQHVLYDDEALLRKVSGLFRKAFGKDILFDYRGGNVIPIHVGEPPAAELCDRVSDAYVAAIRKNPLLDLQGDGMKSYAGILFETIVSNLDITLLDEPEAFLHPPQMRRLGETLSSEVKGQLIVATHSSDILRGFLEGTRGNVRILRIHREGKESFISEAAPEVIQDLWSRPELRYSNALESVFHEQTVICEDDSDCRLINAITDHLAEKDERLRVDTAYIPTGGKHGIRKVAEVLRKVGVPVKGVFDLDFLSEKALVRETVQAFGGAWEEMEPVWMRIDLAVRKGAKPKSPDEIKADIVSIIQESTSESLPKGDICEALKQGTPWNLVKKFGQAGIPAGDAQSWFRSLVESLEAIGIYLVPVGEIENFCRELGSHGPKFVGKVLSEIPFDDERLADLRKFVKRVHEGPHTATTI